MIKCSPASVLRVKSRSIKVSMELLREIWLKKKRKEKKGRNHESSGYNQIYDLQESQRLCMPNKAFQRFFGM